MRLINAIGGIYVDCDTYPIKPFDDELLAKQCFVASHLYHTPYYKQYVRYIDNFFMGSDGKEHQIIDLEDNSICNVECEPEIQSLGFMKRKYDFFKLRIDSCSLNNEKDYYIEHYCANTWRK